MEAAQTEAAFVYPDRSMSIAALAAALAKAQGEMTGAKKDALNPHFKSRYADLASVWDACREALSKNGLSVVQRIFSDPTGVGVRTMLMHSSGEWMQDELVVPVQQRTAQGMGSAITYARRYALQAMVGVAAEDDDGNDASVANDNSPQPQHHMPPVSGRRTAELRQRTSARVAEARGPTQVELWEKVRAAGAIFGKSEEQLKTFVRTLLGGSRQLTEADIPLIEDALAKTAKQIVGTSVGIHVEREDGR